MTTDVPSTVLAKSFSAASSLSPDGLECKQNDSLTDALPSTTETLKAGKYIICPSVRFGATALCAGFETTESSVVPLSVHAVEFSKYEEFLQQEGRAWVALRQQPHKNIPKLIGCRDPVGEAGQKKSNGYLFFNPFYGDLYSECRKRRSAAGPAGERSVRRVLKQMVEAVAHCHKNNIVLGSLKLGKFMFANRERTLVQLAELEGAQLVKPGSSCATRVRSSPAYVAPEILEGGDYDGFAADVWALGVVMFVLVTGTYPFKDTDTKMLFEKIRTCDVAYPDAMSAQLRELLSMILVHDPTERPKASEVLQHDALQDGVLPLLASDAPGVPSEGVLRSASDPVSPEPRGGSKDSGPLEPTTPPTSGRRASVVAASGWGETNDELLHRMMSSGGTASPRKHAVMRRRNSFHLADHLEISATKSNRRPSAKRESWAAGLDVDVQELPAGKRRNSVITLS